MKQLMVQDLLSPEEYEKTRQQYRARIIALKRDRRIAVGDLVTLVFENRETLLFQIQEMIRAERIFESARLQEEVNTYNEQIPGDGELSATLMIEVTDPVQVKPVLDRFKDIDKRDSVALEIGDHSVFGEFEQGRSKEDKISAVHYVRFRIPDAVRLDLQNFQLPMQIAIHHWGYEAKTSVPDKMRASLLEDLAAR